MSRTWDVKTKEGKANVDALGNALSRCVIKEDLQKEVEKEKALKDFSFGAILSRLRRQKKGDTLQKAWENLGRKKNLLYTFFPKEEDHDALSEAFSLSFEEQVKRFPALRSLSPQQRYDIRKQLGVRGVKKDPGSSQVNAEQYRKDREKKHEKNKINPSVLEIEKGWAEDGACYIGYCSRIDYGSDGYRDALVKRGMQEFQRKNTVFNILVGGLVDKRALKAQLKLYLKDRLQELKQQEFWRDLSLQEREKEKLLDAGDFYGDAASELANVIPQIKKPDGSFAKLYIVTSPAYDGEIGEQIAKRLAEIRKEDIVFWNNKTAEQNPLYVKYIDKTILPVVPSKASWRSRYYSTAPQRELQDVEKRSSHILPDVFLVGCFAASVERPQGEAKRPWVTAPALHNIMETRSSENQIGVGFFKYLPDGTFSTINRSFKDLVKEERSHVKTPKDLSELGALIFEQVKKGPQRLGMIEYHLHSMGNKATREEIRKEIENMKQSKFKIVHDEHSDEYDFAPYVLQKKVEYPFKDESNFKEDSIVGFGCLHGGAVYSDGEFFVHEVPALILRRNANLLVGSGDFTQGMQHGLLARGEILAGANDSQQEKIASHIVGKVVMEVFRARFEEWHAKAPDHSPEALRQAILSALVTFLYVSGNHDDWKKREGTSPLSEFTHSLKAYLVREIASCIEKLGYNFAGLHKVVSSKIIKDNLSQKIHYTSPISGLNFKSTHPGTARTETISIPSERALAKYRKAHVVVPANWHQATSVQHYEVELGQRLSLQCPTICTHTPFEDSKSKVTDFGVAFARILSKEGRIIEIESGFYGHGKQRLEDDISNVTYINMYVETTLGCLPIEEK
ncbi:MAG: hypothetical protein Q8O83_03630 [bacterium]|nr:hypothetical protein [bacterium]